MSGVATIGDVVGSVVADVPPLPPSAPEPVVDVAPAVAPPPVLEAADPVRAAGIMHIVDGKVLLIQRSPEGDHSGEWAFPGGKIEDGETPQQAARREWDEELGSPCPDGELLDHLHRIRDGVDFTTFIQRGDETFQPTLNNEHVGFMWAKPSEMPSNLHPGASIALQMMVWNELDFARAIRDGEVTSPQRYRNVWLFDLRITGTGASFRSGLKEFTFRDPGLYLNDEFLARCNGLAVIWEHPEDAPTLDSDEFADRVVGTILLPYIRGDEVWGVAKVYDDEAAAIMRTKQMSTSPAVLLRAADDGQKVSLGDGAVLLIEGQPVLLDHLAICERGVWDKGGAPTGVNISGDLIMADDTTKEEEARKDADDKTEETKEEAKADASEDEKKEEMKADADAGVTLDKVLAKIDSLCTRMDAMESKKDAAEDPADEPKKDADDEPKDEKKEEARADSEHVQTRAELAAVKKQLADITKAMPKHLSDAEFSQFADAQARGDSVFQAFGDSASRPLQGEDLGAYRRRLAGALQKHSRDWKEADLRKMDDTVFAVVEERIYADAMEAAMHPVDVEPGVLREISRVDRTTGQRTIEFAGKNTFIHGMKRRPQRASLQLNRVH